MSHFNVMNLSPPLRELLSAAIAPDIEMNRCQRQMLVTLAPATSG